MRIENIDPQGVVALILLREAATEVRALYPDQNSADSSAATNQPLRIGEVYVAAYLEDSAMGCGALRRWDEITAEVRRIYVRRDHRGRGVGRTILHHLVFEAKRLGYKRLVLETGCRQHPAMKLYEAAGFILIPPFGDYVNDPTSVCYELSLSQP